jgi:hypothetical protein
MKQKVIIALKVLTYLQGPRVPIPSETYGAVHYVLSQAVRVESNGRRNSSTYSVTRGEKLAYAARSYLHWRCRLSRWSYG